VSDALDVDPAADDQAVAVVRRIAAPPGTVFDYLVDPARFVLWMGVAADLDACPGGGYHITVGPDAVATGEYRVVDPPRRLVFTWGWRGDPDVPEGSTTVEILLTRARASNSATEVCRVTSRALVTQRVGTCSSTA